MPLTIQDSRILIKTSSVTTEVPTVAPSNDHTDGTWSVVDVYSGEMFLNTADKKIWFRAASSIVEVATKISNQKNVECYNVTSGTDTYTVGLTPALTSYSVGGTYSIKFGNTNTGASTINIDSLGAVPLIMGGAAVAAGDIVGGVVYIIVYDGTNFHIAGGGGGGGSTNFDDSVFYIYDNSDNTKKLAFEVSGVSTGTTRTLTVPNASGTIALTSDLSGYQPLDADLTSWAGVTRASGFDTFVATPSSANLRSLLTDETGTGAAVFADAPQISTIELGHASDTTLSRSSAGVLAVEGVVLPTISSTNTLTNKRITKRVVSVTSNATPTLNTDNSDIASLTSLAVNVTSFSTNLSGTPNNGDLLSYEITDNGTARTLTWGASFAATGTLSLPTTTVISTLLRVLFQYSSTSSKWEVIAIR